MKSYDVVVIGGGAGGLSAARTAAYEGASSLLISDSPLGGDCTWTGCVPSKTLLEAAARGAGFAEAMAQVHETIAEIASREDATVLASEGVDVIDGRAELVDSHTVMVHGEHISAAHIVLATGATPVLPPVPGLDDVGALTSEDLWDLQEPPRRLAILGGGPIGCELAEAMARLGVKVTIYEMADRVLAREEPEASEIILRVLNREGVEVRLGQPVQQAARANDGQILLTAGGTTDRFDRVLVAAGRRPSSRGFGVEEVGIALTDRGHIAVDDKLRTNIDHIFAIGDVNGLLPFTHAADEQGRLVAWQATGSRRAWKFDAQQVPWVTFTSPEVARIGVAEADAPRGSRVAFVPLSEVDRAVAANQTEGFVKLIAAPRRVLRNLGGGRLVGATIVAPRAGEMIHEPALLLRTGGFVGRLAQLTHAYPTWSMAIGRAAGQFFQPVGGLQARPAKRSR